MSVWQTAKQAVRERILSQLVATYAYKATPEISAKITVAVSSGTPDKFTDTTENLSVFSESQRIIVSGRTNSANNGLFTVQKELVTEDEIPVAETTLVTESVGDATTIQTALPMQFDNDNTFIRPDTGLWTRTTFHTIIDELLDVGENNGHRYVGMAWIEIYDDKGNGDKRISVLADSVVNIFIDSTTKKPVTADGVQYRIPQLREMGVDGDSYRNDVQITFEYDY